MSLATSFQISANATRRVLWLGIAIALSIGSIWWLATAVDYGEALAAVGQAKTAPLIAACLMVVSVFIFRAERWRLLLADEHGPDRWELFRALMAGFVTNTISPVRAGELARVLVVTGRSGRAPQSVTASIVFEKWLDTVALLLIAGVALVTGLTQASFSGSLLILLAIAVVIGGSGVWALRYWRPTLASWHGQSSFISTVANFVGSTVVAFVRQRRASNPSRDLAIGGFTALAFGAGFVVNVLVLSAYSVETASLMWLAGLLLVTLYIGGAAPAPPARLGIYHAIVFATLTSQGVSPGPSLAIALTMHAITVLLPLALGLGALWLPRPAGGSID